MSARLLDAHFGALQQKGSDCGRDATACDFDIPARLAERRGVLYNQRQA